MLITVYGILTEALLAPVCVQGVRRELP